MNYLAHFHLAGNEPGLQIGALLGDFVKGTPDSASFLSAAHFAQLPEHSEAGILLHRRIDASFDRLRDVVEFRKQGDPRHRRLQGIAQDLLFDHLLARNWRRYHAKELEQYCDEIFALLAAHENCFPDNARRFSQRLREHRLPLRYRQRELVLDIGIRIAGRWGMEASMESLLASLLDNPADTEAHFRRVYPQMQSISAEWIAGNMS